MKKIINISIIAISALLIGFVLIMSLLPNITLDLEIVLICFLLPILIIFFTMVIQIKRSKAVEEKNKIIKYWLNILFVIYCVLLLVVLFLNNAYRRFPALQSFNPFSIEHLKTINIVPFATITNHLMGIKNNSITALNIIVNLILFAPMGFFVPLLFKDKIKNTLNFVFLIILISLSVEILQFITWRGATDIDDIILNTLGACIIYILMKLKLVKRLLNKILDLEY